MRGDKYYNYSSRRYFFWDKTSQPRPGPSRINICSPNLQGSWTGTGLEAGWHSAHRHCPAVCVMGSKPARIVRNGDVYWLCLTCALSLIERVHSFIRASTTLQTFCECVRARARVYLCATHHTMTREFIYSWTAAPGQTVCSHFKVLF